MAVISRPEQRQPSSLSCGFQFKADANQKLLREATVFSVVTYIEISGPATSACCLLFVKDGRELWVGCGNMVAIVDTETLEVVHKFRAYVSPRSNVRSMVSDGSTVFTVNRRTPDVFQWSVETRRRICKFHIGQENPRGLKLAELVTSTKGNDVNASDVTDDVRGDDDDVVDVTSENSADDFVSHDRAEEDEKGSVMDIEEQPQMYIDVEHPMSRSTRQPSLMRSLKRDRSKNSSRRKHRNVPEDSAEDPTGLHSDSARNRMRSRTQVYIFHFCIW